jgi:hypothetical protein
MDRPVAAGHHSPMPYERSRVFEAARRILERRGWCLYEVCVDVTAQRWEARALLLDLTAEGVAEACEAEIELEPEHDARLTGVDRGTFAPLPGIGPHLVYLSDRPGYASA